MNTAVLEHPAVATPDDASVEATARKLLEYCRSRDWAGHDPYDALNSRLIAALPLLNARWPRIALTQALKRSPVNIRTLAGVPRTQNPKGIGLFLTAVLRYPALVGRETSSVAHELVGRLIALRSPCKTAWCWGYSFPWQTRTQVVPRGTPNLVCTTFVADALLDAYERLGDQRCVDMATSAASYIVEELYRETSDAAGFCYPLPSMSFQIHNANLLAAALLCRVRKHTGDDALLGPAVHAARYSTARQREDGSWPYGEGNTQGWIDNFHTGYNLCALQDIRRHLETDEFDDAIRDGLAFYCDRFFAPNGIARYFHDRTYPIDIHAVAQSIITLTRFAHEDAACAPIARSVLDWAMQHMWDARGFFYYRVLRYATIRTPYMRWSQAWMLVALATYLERSHHTP